jgi:hypothetical protein
MDTSKRALHLASFCAYASSTPLPECLQGSIPGPSLAVSWAGFAPARTTRHCQAATSGRLEHSPGGARTHWKSAALSRRTPTAVAALLAPMRRLTGKGRGSDGLIDGIPPADLLQRSRSANQAK